MKHDPKKLYEEYLKAVAKHTNPVGAVTHNTDVQAPGMASGGKAKLGSGERFAALKEKLSHQEGIKDPGALAASIGRKKYGAKKFNKLSHMSDGGEAKDTDLPPIPQADLDELAPKPTPEPKEEKRVKEVESKSKAKMADGGKVKGYDDGGPVESTLMQLGKKLKEAFEGPEPSPTPAPQSPLEEKYEKIRRERSLTPGQSYAMGGKIPPFVPEGNIKHYDQGGAVDPLEARKNQLRQNLQAVGIPDDQIEAMVAKSIQPEVPSMPNARPMPAQMSPVPGGQTLDSNPYQNAAKVMAQQPTSMPGYYDGEDVKPEENDDTGMSEMSADQSFEEGPESPSLLESELIPEERAGQRKADEEEQSELTPEEKDAQDLMAMQMAQGNDQDINAKRQTGVDQAASQSPEMQQLDQKNTEDLLKEQGTKTDPASGLQTSSALQRLIAATSQPQGMDLKQAQADRDRNIALNQMQQGAAIMGAGMAHASPDQVLGVIKGQEKYAGLPVQKYEELIANQKNDSTSTMSKVTRDYFKNTLHMDVPENASYADLDRVAGFVTKQQGLQMQLQKALLGIASRERIAEQSSKDREAQTKAYQERTEKQNGSLNDRKMQTRFDALTKDLAQGGGQPVTLQRTNLNRAQNLFLTNGVDPNIRPEDIDKIPDEKLNNINKIQVVENGIELNRLLSGSNQGAQTTLNKLIPNNLNMTATQIMDYASSNLNPAEQAQALKAYMKVAARVRDQAKQNVQTYQKQRLAGSGDILKYFPEQGKLLLDQHGLSMNDLKGNQPDRVNVIGPDGKAGTIPANQLQDALKQGYRQQ